MTKHQDLKHEVKRSWKLKNAKVVPVMMKNFTEILKTIPGNVTPVGNRPVLSKDPEESSWHKTLKTENIAAWSVNRDPLPK